ncbi:MAG: ATP-binding protein [Spirochaetia bacterium]|nr:ATP-binding protein [Spirochaetia bacterium]
MEKQIIKEVLADAKYSVRHIELMKRKYPFEKNANYVLTGIRRAGKTFLLYQRMQELVADGTSWDEILYINFEDERLLDFSAIDLNILIELHIELYGMKPILFLDELQNIQGWEKFARRMADQGYRIYITGSNAKMLSSDVATILGGRFLIQEVYPYSFKEFLAAENVDFYSLQTFSTAERAHLFRLFDEYFRFGGFPEVTKYTSKRSFLLSLYQKIFLGDIGARHNLNNIFALRVMMKKVAEATGQPLSFNRLRNIIAATGTKIGTSTIINYVEYAKESRILFGLHNIAAKLSDKESSLKYYFADNGLLSLFLIDYKTALLENLVALELIRRYGQDDAVYYYKNKIEVDFYVPEQELAIQACYALTDLTIEEREAMALTRLCKVLPCRTLQIITYDTEKTLSSNGRAIQVLPVWKWLLE